VIAALNNPASRITLAIVLSALLHAGILWLPYIQLPHAKVELPPLTARLEPLPKPVEQPAATPEPANPITKSELGASIKSATRTLDEMDKTEESSAAHPFPKQLRLTFAVHKGADGFMTGEIHHQLDINGDRYTLKSVRQTAGLASLRNSDRLIQASHGKIGEHGLQPDTFDEKEITRDGKQSLQATFDWAAQKLRFSHGDETTLPADAQDTLSFLYQLSQLPMNGEFFPLPVSDGTQLQQYQIEIGTKEDIATPMGKLRALHLRKMHAQGEAYFEIWLGLEYRLLPVKFIQVDSSGNVTYEFVITDIRAAEE
jgi:Protein of unknown function (DUF3108)